MIFLSPAWYYNAAVSIVVAANCPNDLVYNYFVSGFSSTMSQSSSSQFVSDSSFANVFGQATPGIDDILYIRIL